MSHLEIYGVSRSITKFKSSKSKKRPLPIDRNIIILAIGCLMILGSYLVGF